MRDGELSAATYTLIVTAKLNNVDLGDTPGRIAGMPQTRPSELLPWHRMVYRCQAIVA